MFSPQTCIFKPTPKSLGTLLVNTTTLTYQKQLGCFSAYFFLGGGVLPFPFSLIGMTKTTKTTTKKENQTTRSKQANNLVLCKKDKTHINNSNFVFRSNNPTRKSILFFWGGGASIWGERGKKRPSSCNFRGFFLSFVPPKPLSSKSLFSSCLSHFLLSSLFPSLFFLF